MIMGSETIKYMFAEEYTKYPGGRFEKIGEYSGEHFRETVLRKIFEENKTIEIDATGLVMSLSPSFLYECFGELAVEYGLEKFKKTVKLYSDDNPNLTEKMMFYVERAVNSNG